MNFPQKRIFFILCIFFAVEQKRVILTALKEYTKWKILHSNSKSWKKFPHTVAPSEKGLGVWALDLCLKINPPSAKVSGC
jgi:hypothetical protein